MSHSPDSNLFPWEDLPSTPSPAEAGGDASPQPDTVDPFSAEGVPPVPAEVAPDAAAERVHQDEFEDPAASDTHAASPEHTEASSSEDAQPASTQDAVSAAPEDEDAAAAPAARRADHGRQLVRKEYYSISEVSDLVGLPAHVLRYWESQFSVLNPSKNRSGNRVYQRKEIRLILLVTQLLYEDKYTVEGAKQKLDQLRRGGELPAATTRALNEQVIDSLREELRVLSELLAPDAR